jgi:hypothetical protein
VSSCHTGRCRRLIGRRRQQHSNCACIVALGPSMNDRASARPGIASQLSHPVAIRCGHDDAPEALVLALGGDHHLGITVGRVLLQRQAQFGECRATLVVA